MTEDPIVNSVIQRHIERSARGMKTYGKTLANNDTKTLREWLEEALEEALDQAVYLAKAIEKLDQETYKRTLDEIGCRGI